MDEEQSGERTRESVDEPPEKEETSKTVKEHPKDGDNDEEERTNRYQREGLVDRMADY